MKRAKTEYENEVSLRDGGPRRRRLLPQLSEEAYSLALTLPLLIWILVTMIYPLFYGIRLSLTDTRLIGVEGDFIGFRNFARLLADPSFHGALKRTINWTLGNALIQGILGLATGLLLQQTFLGRGTVRTWILMPWIVPTVAIAVLWRWILSGTFGIVNYILMKLSLTDVGIPFLGSPDYAMLTSIMINSWRWFPFLAIVALAALLNIPREEYEAARMDGAGFWQELRFITFPHLSPTLTILGLIGTLLSFNLFDVLWLLTKGGPADTTRTLALWVYEMGFRYYFLGKAAAISAIMMVVLLLLMVIYLRVNKSALSLFAPTEEEET